MNRTFQSLVDPTSLYSGDQSIMSVEARRDGAFKELVESSLLHLWDRTETIPGDGLSWSVGVMSASRYELHLLDLLQYHLENGGIPANDRFYILDAFFDNNDDYVSTMEKFLPGYEGLPALTPFVGRWQSGIVQEMSASYSARKMLSQWYNLDLFVTAIEVPLIVLPRKT